MSDPVVLGFDAVGDEYLFLVAHKSQPFEGARNGRGEGEATA